MIVIHYTGMIGADAALDRLCDPEAKVSAHWLIEEDGTSWHLVAEEARAWHAGIACWEGHMDVNSRSIGIELVNPGHEFGYRPFPRDQMTRLAALCHAICGRRGIRSSRILGHSDVAPDRKSDPGELFDWAWLAGEGLGLWPFGDEATRDRRRGSNAEAALAALARFGYCVPVADHADVVRAFQRHFRPARIDGVLDDETIDRALRLAEAAARGA